MNNLYYIVLYSVLVYFFFWCFNNKEYFSPRDPLLDELQSQLSVIHPRFKNVNLFEGDKSYTVNKEKIFVCLKDTHGRYYSRNMLVYVICHEYAHMLCDEIGHTDKFFKIFDRLLKKASEMGLYDPSIPPVDEYCGHD